MKQCLNHTCEELTSNPKYCSRSCSASHSNTVTVRKKARKYFCNTCMVIVPSRRKFCDECRPGAKDLTLEEATYKTGHRSSAFALVRSRARSFLESKRRYKECQNCGYNRHVEVCHIQPISGFPDTTLLSTINSLSNLAYLCPNCHWEFDHGMLDKEEFV